MARSQKTRRERLREADETLRAIREGEVDAVIVSGERGEQVNSLVGAESVYRLIVETMNEAAVTTTLDGRILFANARFGQFVKRPLEQIVGHPLREFVAPQDAPAAEALLAAGQREPVRQRLVFQARDGATVPAHVSTTVLKQSGDVSLCLVATDLTELERSTELVRHLRRQDEALRESEERLRLATSATNDVIWDLDVASGIVRWYDAYAAVFGRPPETGDPWPWWQQRIHPEDRERADGGFRAALDGPDDLWTCEYRYLRADGTYAHIYDRARIARDAQGRATRVVGAMMDRTRQKQAAKRLFEANQRFKTLMNALPVGVSFSVDPSCRVIRGNPAALAQFDAAAGDNLSASATDARARGRQVQYLHQGRPIGADELPLQRAMAENRVIPPIELEVVMPGGRRWYMDASGAPIRDIEGQAVGGVAVTVDITSRKEAEAALRQANANLETRIQERTAELEQRAAQLRALAADLTLSEQRERRRLARVLHDHLQQLLAGAKFRTATLGRGLVPSEACGCPLPSPRCQQAVLEIESLLDTALDTSRSLSAELSPPILHERGLSPGLEWLARWMAERHGLTVELSMEEGLSPTADDVKVLLFESVRELLFNAVKHAGVRSAAVGIRQVQGRELQIVVSDAGPGFDPATLGPREAGGGLGLFGIRERLDLVGGRLEIDSAAGKGSRFTLTVPLGPAAVAAPSIVAAEAQTAAARPRVRVPSSRPGAPIRVLLADDHAVTREGIRQLLGLEPGIQIVGEAVDGEAAVEMAGRLQPDVVLMDIGMPKLDGVEATRVIRRNHPGIRVIGLSMFEEKERAQAMREAGASDYFSKSAPSADLIAAVLSVPSGAGGKAQPPEVRPPEVPRQS